MPAHRLPALHATIAVALTLLASCSVADAPSADRVVSALARGGEVELGELDGEGFGGYATYSWLECDARDACLLVHVEDELRREVLALALGHDGTPRSARPTVLAHDAPLTSFADVIGVESGVDGFAVLVSHAEAGVGLAALDLVCVDGAARERGRARLGQARHDELLVGRALWFDGTAFSVVHEADAGPLWSRYDPSTCAVLGSAPLSSVIHSVECGPERCLGNVDTRALVIFDRGARPDTATLLPGRGAPLAATAAGFVVHDYESLRIDVRDVAGDRVASYEHDRRIQLVAAGGRRALFYGTLADGRRAMLELDLAAPPPSLELRPVAGLPEWERTAAAAWRPGHWLLAWGTDRLLASEPSRTRAEMDWSRFSEVTLELERTFTGDENVRAPEARGARVASFGDGWVATWHEYGSEGGHVWLARLERDGTVRARRRLHGDYAGEIVTGEDVIAMTDGYPTQSLARFDGELRSLGAPIEIDSAAIAWDGERFVVVQDDGLIRHATDPALPPEPISDPMPAGLAPVARLTATAGGVVAFGASGAVARWLRGRGWAPVVIESPSGRVVAVDGDRAAVVTTDRLAPERGTRVESFALDSDPPRVVASVVLPLGLHPGAVVRRGGGWLVGVSASEWATGRFGFYALELDGALPPELWPVHETLADGDAPSLQLACAADGSCFAAYERYVAESPYRTVRARGRTLFALPEGEACAADHECASGRCVEALCCATCVIDAGVEEPDAGGADAGVVDAGSVAELDAGSVAELDAGSVAELDAGARTDAGEVTDAAGPGVSSARGGGCGCRASPSERRGSLIGIAIVSGVLAMRRRRFGLRRERACPDVSSWRPRPIRRTRSCPSGRRAGS